MAHTKKAVPGHGEGGGDSHRKGQVGADTDCIKKAVPACPVRAICCGAVTVFHHRRTKNFSCLSCKGAEKKSFLFACFVFSCPAKSSVTVSEEAEKVFDFGNGGKFLFHFADGII